MTVPDIAIARDTAALFATGLARISDEDLFPVFQLAWSRHENPREPFGVIQINRAFEEICEQRLAEKRRVEGAQVLRDLRAGLSAPQCYYCNDRGMQAIRHRDGYTSLRPCVCERSRGGTRPAQPFCEANGWSKNHRNEWERTTQ